MDIQVGDFITWGTGCIGQQVVAYIDGGFKVAGPAFLVGTGEPLNRPLAPYNVTAEEVERVIYPFKVGDKVVIRSHRGAVLDTKVHTITNVYESTTPEVSRVYELSGDSWRSNRGLALHKPAADPETPQEEPTPVSEAKPPWDRMSPEVLDPPTDEPVLAQDVITKPDHYARWLIEPITFIMRNGFEFWRGNIVKYATRAGHKVYDGMDAAESEITDLRKVVRYAEIRINQLNGEVEL